MNSPYNLSDNFLVRTPYLSLLNWSLQFKVDYKKELLAHFRTDDEIKQALLLASPEFYEIIINGSDEIILEKELLTLTKYASRQASRATPFGLFSGVNMGNFENSANSINKIVRRQNPVKHKVLRIDNGLVFQMVEKMLSEDSILRELSFYANPTLYQINNTYRYIEFTYDRLRKRHHRLTEIKNKNSLYSLFKLIKKAVPYKEIELFFIKQGADPDEIPSIVSSLLDNKLIFSNIHPSVTEVNTLGKLRNYFDEHGIIYTSLSSLVTMIDEYNQTAKNNSGDLEQIQAFIDNAGGFEGIKQKFQIDYVSDYAEYVLDKKSKNKIAETVNFLCMLPGNRSYFTIDTFIEQFTKSYGSQEMPLCEVLDPDLGIGFPVDQYGKNADPGTLLNEINIPDIKKVAGGMNWGWFEDMILEKYFQFLENPGASSINLTADDIPSEFRYSKNNAKLFTTMVQYINSEAGDFLMNFKGIGGNSPLHLNTRFAYLDSEILKSLKSFLHEHTDKDGVNAEILTFPEDRLGNVIQHPSILDYEIPIFSNTSVKQENVISLDDLYLKIINGRLVLFSRSLNKTVTPWLLNAHVYHQTDIPVYSFLSDYAHYLNNSSSHVFHWPEILRKRDYLPRVAYKECIISRARWNIKSNRIAKYPEGKKLEKLAEWLSEIKIPQYLFSIEGDKELLLNSQNELHLKILLKDLIKFGSITLYESLIEDSMQNIDRSSFFNEIVLSFTKK